MKGFFGGRIYSHQLPAPTQSFSFLIADAAAVLLLQLLPLVQSSLAFALMPKRPSPAPARTAPFPSPTPSKSAPRPPPPVLRVASVFATNNTQYILFVHVRSTILDSCACSPNLGHLLLPVKRSPRRRRREKLCTRSMVKSDCILITEPIPSHQSQEGLACLLAS